MPLRLISTPLKINGKFSASLPTGWSRGSNASHVSSITGHAAYLVGTQQGITPSQPTSFFRRFSDDGIPTSQHISRAEPIEGGGSDPYTPKGPGCLVVLPTGRFAIARSFFVQDPGAFPTQHPFLVVDLYEANGTQVTSTALVLGDAFGNVFGGGPTGSPRLNSLVCKGCVDPSSSRFTIAVPVAATAQGSTYVVTFDYNLVLKATTLLPSPPSVSWTEEDEGMRPTLAICRIDVDVPLYQISQRTRITSPFQVEQTYNFVINALGHTSGYSLGGDSGFFGDGSGTTRTPPFHPDLMVGPIASAYDSAAHRIYLIDQHEAAGTISVRLHQWAFVGGSGNYSRGGRDVNVLIHPPAVPFNALTPSPQPVTNQPGDELIILPDGKLLIAYPCPYFYLDSFGNPATNNNSRLLIIDPTVGSVSVVEDIDLGYVGDVSISAVGNRIYVLSHRIRLATGGALYEDTYLESYWYDTATQPNLSLEIADAPGATDTVTLPGSATKYLLSETQTTRPNTSAGFSSVKPTGFSPAPPGGGRTVYAWFEKSGTISILPNFSSYTATGSGFSNSISVKDRTTGNISITNEQTISVSISPAISNVDAFLSDSQTTPPSPSDIRFSFVPGPLSETSFALSASQGNHDVYLWLKSSGVVNTIAIVDSISLDSVVSAPFTLNLYDRIGGSQALTNEPTVSCNVQAASFSAHSYQLTESLTPPADTNPSWVALPSGNFFVPHVFSNTLDGQKTLYLHLKENSSDAIATTSDTITLQSGVVCFEWHSLFHLLHDQSSGSQTVTDSRLINVEIIKQFGCDISQVEYILSESSTVPNAGDPRWICCLQDVFSGIITHSITSPGDGLKTIYFFKKDNADNIYGATPRTIRLDTTVDANIVFTIRDRTSLSETYTNETIIEVDLAGSTDGQFDQINNLVFAVDRNPTPPGFFTLIRSNFPFQSNLLNDLCDGIKTVYIHVADPIGNIISLSKTITLDRTLSIQNLSLSLKDRTTNDPNFTNESVISVTITASTGLGGFCIPPFNEFGSLQFFLSESSGSVMENDSGFGPLPSTFALSPTLGPKTVYLWAKDLAGNLSPSPAQDTIELTVAVNASISVNVLDRTSGSADITNERIISVSSSGSGPDFPTLRYFLSEDPVPPIPSNPGWMITVPQTFYLNNPGDGLKDVYLHAKSLDNNIISALDFITLDTALDVSGFSLSLTDRTSGSALYTNDEIVSVSFALSGPEAGDVTYFISESLTTPSPAAFSTVQPTLFDLSSGDGPKTVRLWIKDVADHMTFAADSIILDTIFNASLNLSLADRTDGSGSATDERIISTQVMASGPDSSGLVCFLSEFQTTPPNETDPRFAGSIPGTYELSIGSGTKTVYVWCKDLAGNVGNSATGILLTSGIAPDITLSDRIVNDASITREHVISVFFNPDGINPPVTKWLVSEIQSTPPATTHPGFTVTTPQTFQLQTIVDLVNGEFEVRTVYAWVQDGTQILHTVPAAATIQLGARPAPASLVLADRTSGSNSLTAERTISVQPAGVSNIRDGNISGYLLTESSSTPAYNDIRFSATAPQTFHLSASSAFKTVHLWVRNRYFVSDTSASAAIEFAASGCPEAGNLSENMPETLVQDRPSFPAETNTTGYSIGQSQFLFTTPATLGYFVTNEPENTSTSITDKYRLFNSSGSFLSSEFSDTHTERPTSSAASAILYDKRLLVVRQEEKSADPNADWLVLDVYDLTTGNRIHQTKFDVTPVTTERYSSRKNRVSVSASATTGTIVVAYMRESAAFGINGSYEWNFRRLLWNGSSLTPLETSPYGSFYFPAEGDKKTVLLVDDARNELIMTKSDATGFVVVQRRSLSNLATILETVNLFSQSSAFPTGFVKDGPISMVKETDGKYTVYMMQAPTPGGISTMHWFKFQIISGTTSLVSGPTQFHVPVQGDSAPSNELGEEIVTLANGKRILPAPNFNVHSNPVLPDSPSKLLVLNASNVVTQIVSLPSSGDVSIAQNGDKIFVLHRRSIYSSGGSSFSNDLYLMGFEDCDLGSNLFTHIVRPGNNLITPALKLDPFPMRVAHFLPQNGDVMLYLDENNNAQSRLGFSYAGQSPGDPEWENDIDNPQMEGGIGYVLIPSGLSSGEIRTVSFSGSALSN